jgi:NADH dehydrogenase
MKTQAEKTRIVILGGGFAGMYAAMELEKKIGADPNIQVTLVNRDNFFLFTPMLHEVAASDLELTAIVNPIHKLLKRVEFFCGGVDRIDLDQKRVTVSHGASHHSHELKYDHLVIAMGSVTNFYDLPGLQEHAFTMKSLGDAIHLRNHVIAMLEEANFECAREDRESLLTFVVAGGGFAGVETIASINDFVAQAIRFYPNLKPEEVRMVLVHPGEVILPELNEKLGRFAQQKIAGRGVEVLSKTKVKGYVDQQVELIDGTVIPSETLIWTAGTSPNPMIDELACAKERGRIVVNPCMQLPDWPGVWALGDCARVMDERTGKAHPPTAQHASREGTLLARNIVASLRQREPKPFKFRTLGQLATIGHRNGVARILGVNFSGFIAWFLWRTIYLMKLPRFEKKVRVAIDWTLDLIFSKDIVQYLTDRSQRGSLGAGDEESSTRSGVFFEQADQSRQEEPVAVP